MSECPTALIADDSQSFLMYLSILLHRMSFNVIPAGSGAEALKLAKVMRPDVLVLDVIMPDLDGIAALRALRDDPEINQMPVIMISCDQDARRRDECFGLGAMDYLAKPVSVARLHTALQKCDLYPGGRRRYLRALFGEKVTLIHAGQAESCYAVTLSEGGIYLRRQRPLPVGSRVEVKIEDDKGRAPRFAGEVIYTRSLDNGKFLIPPGMAIKFIDLEANEARQLNQMVANLLIGDLIDEQEESFLRIE